MEVALSGSHPSSPLILSDPGDRRYLPQADFTRAAPGLAARWGGSGRAELVQRGLRRMSRPLVLGRLRDAAVCFCGGVSRPSPGSGQRFGS